MRNVDMENNIQNFYDLEVWKVGHNLVLDIYKITNKFPREETFGITSRLRRASSSITANIAEGFARYHFPDKRRFYYQARGSIAEVQNFLILARDLSFIDCETCKNINDTAVKTRQLLNGLIRSVTNQT
jgi:four helix bundle protein